MVLRNVNNRQFEVYDIVNNQITSAFNIGAVGLDFQLGGFAVDPPTVSGTFTDISSDQLAQNAGLAAARLTIRMTSLLGTTCHSIRS